MAFTYDANGNRLTKRTGWGTISYSYGPEDELLTAGRASYRYDRDGRLIEETNAEGITSYRYDARGRMVQADTSVKGERKTIRYEYDALGRTTVRQEAGIKGQRMVYDAFSFDEVRSLALDEEGTIV